MKVLYLDLGMGAAGDMLAGALLGLLPDPDSFISELNAVGIPGVRFEKEPSVKCGIAGTHVRVTVNGAEESGEHHHHGHGGEGDSHHHGTPEEIARVVNERLNVPERVRKEIIAVYSLISEAESAVHGVPVTDIHFHEVGTMDALADVTAVCMLIDRVAPDEIVASPVHVGTGTVRCAHGILPVPAPATAHILRGAPTYGGAIDGELCTPTGAALLRRFVTRFGDMPVVRVEKIGYGMGTKDFPAANCVRAMLGEAEGKRDRVYELSFNVDDMTGEEIGFAAEMLFSAGARDVFTVPVGMKKGRPGTMITAICDRERREAVVAAIFAHTTTLGVRESEVGRYVLDRETREKATRFGAVGVKRSSGYGVVREKAEYDDVARIAKENGLGFRAVKKAAEDGDD